MEVNIKFTKTKERLPLDGSDPDEQYPSSGYLVVSDLGSIHQMSYRKEYRSFFFPGNDNILVDMNLVIAWAPLEDSKNI